jgi:FlaG/FlaF family flagellin (archaellin)
MGVTIAINAFLMIAGLIVLAASIAQVILGILDSSDSRKEKEEELREIQREAQKNKILVR